MNIKQKVFIIWLVTLIAIIFNFSSVFATPIVSGYGNFNSNYDRYNTLLYQEFHYNWHNPSYEYINDANCTNYVSQVVKSGGMSEISSYSTPSKDTDTRNWYYAAGTLFTNRCRTWVVAPDFRNHWGTDINGNGNKRGYYSMITTLSDWYNNWDEYGYLCHTGDILQLYGTEDTPYHSMAVYWTEAEGPWVFDIIYTGNSRDTMDSFASVFLTLYQDNPNERVGLIKISGID